MKSLLNSKYTQLYINIILLLVFGFFLLFSKLVLTNTDGGELSTRKNLPEDVIKKALSMGDFTQNTGQAPEDIKYFFRSTKGGVFFTEDKVIFQNFYDIQDKSSVREVVYSMSFTNALEGVMIIGEGETGTANYIIGKNEPISSKKYEKIVYKSIYENIDVEFIFLDGKLKYNILVYPGGDPNKVSFFLDGVEEISTTKEGKLKIITPAETFYQEIPIVYQEKKSEKVIINSAYKINIDKSFSFVFGDYDNTNLLIIDPIFSSISASTFLGGSGNDVIYDMTLDVDDNIIAVGKTSSSDFPVTAGAYDETYNTCEEGCGSYDAFIVKISPLLSASPTIVTYLGSTTGDDIAVAVDIASNGNIVVSGSTTDGGGFPISPDAFQTSGGSFITIFSSSIDAPFVASTLLNANIYDNYVNSAGSVIVVGTAGAAYVTTTDAYDVTFNGGTDIFLSVFSTLTATPTISTYLTNETSGGVPHIVTDNSENTYVAWNTGSGISIRKFSASFDASSLLASASFSRLSNQGNVVGDDVGGIGIDVNGNVILGGVTCFNSLGPGDFCDEQGIYVSKYTSELVLTASTTGLTDYVSSGVVKDLVIDNSGNIYISGNSDINSTAGSYQENNAGGIDTFLAKYTSNLQLEVATYLGGNSDDTPHKLLVHNANSKIFIAGETNSTNFPISVGAYDTSHSGTTDAFLTSFSLNTPPTLTTSTPSQTSASIVTVSTTLTDTDNDITSLIVEHSTNGTTWVSSTLSTVTPSEGAVTTATGQISGIDTDLDGSVQLTISWNIETDLPDTVTSTVYLRFTPNDGTENGTTATTSVFAIDTADPSVPGNLSVATLSSSTISFTFPNTTSTDTNFREYKIHYSTTTPVTSSASAFTSTTDVNLGNSNFTGESASAAFSVSVLTPNTLYYFNLFAYDTWSHSTSSVLEVSTTTYAKLPSALSSSGITQTAATITWLANNNPVGTEFYAENSANSSMNSGWITTSTSTFSSLTCGTSYSFRVKARNSVEVASDWSEELSVSTSACDQQGGGGQLGVGEPPDPPPPEHIPEPICKPEDLSCEEEVLQPTGLVVIKKLNPEVQIFYTNTPKVIVYFDAHYADQIGLAESTDAPSDDFEGSSFGPTENRIPWTFKSGDGKKCINAKFWNTQKNYTYTTYACVYLDTVKPKAPSVESVNTGIVNNTIVSKPSLSGTVGEPSLKIIITRNTLATAMTPLSLAQASTYYTQADAQGNWSFNFPAYLNQGTHELTIQAEDLAENISRTTVVAMNITLQALQQENPDPQCIGDACIEDDPCAGGLCEEPEPEPVCIGDACIEPEPTCVGDDCIEGTDLIQDLDTNIQEQTETKTDGKNTEQFIPKISSSTLIENVNNGVSTTIQTIAKQTNAFITRAKQTLPPITKKLMTLAQDPQVERINETALAPTVLIATAANVATSFGLGQLLIYLRYLFTQPLTLLGMRKRKKWGVVYNGFTKQPIDLALLRLIDTKTDKIIETQVSDTKGRYVFVSNPGEYRLDVSKPGYVGFSVHLKEFTQDLQYQDLYHGETITLTPEKNIISSNIPLDPDSTIIPTKKLLKLYTHKVIHLSLSSVSVLIAFISLLISPTPFVAFILAIQVLVYIIFHYLSQHKLGKNFGTIFHQEKHRALKHTVIRIFDAQYNRLIDTKISNSKGMYAALVGVGKYIVTYEKPKFEVKQATISIASHEKMGGVIARDEKLVRIKN